MDEIIETTQLEFDKSAFLIDLVKHSSGSLFIKVIQTIKDGEKGNHSIKINPSILTDIIKVLQNYNAKIPYITDYSTKHLTESDQQKIQEIYLKGVPLKDVAFQFDQSEELIEMVLRNKGIKIVPKVMPKRWRRRKRWY